MTVPGNGNRHSAAQVYRYLLNDGWEVVAGRTDVDNDRLSIREAHPNDWWFHVRGQPGSHVLLRHRPGREPDRNIIKQAAAIAAWHSKSRHGGVVAVSCTQARNVSKPRGTKPGSVQIRRETVVKVRPGLPPSS